MLYVRGLAGVIPQMVVTINIVTHVTIAYVTIVVRDAIAPAVVSYQKGSPPLAANLMSTVLYKFSFLLDKRVGLSA
jgi:hypothetical protein